MIGSSSDDFSLVNSRTGPESQISKTHCNVDAIAMSIEENAMRAMSSSQVPVEALSTSQAAPLSANTFLSKCCTGKTHQIANDCTGSGAISNDD
jgi:hypothetical protein